MDSNKLRTAKIKQLLQKQIKHDNNIMTWKQLFINHVMRVEIAKTDNMHKYNRTKFNKIDNDKDQDQYMNNLKKEVTTYRAVLKNESFLNISILLFEGFKLLNSGKTINKTIKIESST